MVTNFSLYKIVFFSGKSLSLYTKMLEQWECERHKMGEKEKLWKHNVICWKIEEKWIIWVNEQNARMKRNMCQGKVKHFCLFCLCSLLFVSLHPYINTSTYVKILYIRSHYITLINLILNKQSLKGYTMLELVLRGSPIFGLHVCKINMYAKMTNNREWYRRLANRWQLGTKLVFLMGTTESVSSMGIYPVWKSWFCSP